MEYQKPSLAGILILLLLSINLSAEEESGTQEAAPPKPLPIETNAPPYIPPAPANPTPMTRVATGGTRGPDLKFPTVTLLVPEHVGRTILEQPSLFWYVSNTTRQPTVFTLSINDQINPLLELNIGSPVKAGVHKLDFKEHNIRLVAGKIYDWSVSINENADTASSGDLVARAFIQRVEETDKLASIATETDPLKKALAYAQNGIWYDAFTTLSQKTADDALRQQLSRQMTALLKQVGIPLPTP